MSNQSDLKEFLQGEIKRIKRGTRKTWMIGIPLVLFVLCYMSWLAYKMNTLVFVPRNLAIYIAQGVDREAPRVIADAEKQMKAMAPAVARAFNNEVHKMINELGAIGNQQVEAFESLLPYVDRSAQKAVDDYFKIYGAEVKVAYEEEGSDQLATRIVDSIFEEIGSDLAKKIHYVEGGN